MNKYEYHICISYGNRNEMIKSYEIKKMEENFFLHVIGKSDDRRKNN